MTRCQATTKAGRPCGRNARPGSDYCAQHEPGKDRGGDIKNILVLWLVFTGLLSFLAEPQGLLSDEQAPVRKAAAEALQRLDQAKP